MIAFKCLFIEVAGNTTLFGNYAVSLTSIQNDTIFKDSLRPWTAKMKNRQPRPAHISKNQLGRKTENLPEVKKHE